MTAHGVYVDLEPYGLEGFVPIENLTDDQYQFDEKAMVLRGKLGSFVRYGERMKTKVVSVDTALQRPHPDQSLLPEESFTAERPSLPEPQGLP